MLDDFILRALIAGVGVALIAGALGCFVVWRRMAYFGDSLSHSALLGIALGLLYGAGANPGVALVCSVFALALVWLQRRDVLATDTLLGILAHTALAAGMIAVSFLDQPGFDLHGYLFGDVLTVTTGDLYWIYGGGAAVLGLMVANWPALTLMSLHQDLARAEGVNAFAVHLLLVFLMVVVVAMSIRVVGVLLITSLLIIPAAAARQLARSPETMAAAAAVIGASSVVVGIFASMRFDTPSGPSIVVAAAGVFVTLYLAAPVIERLRHRSKRSLPADLP